MRIFIDLGLKLLPNEMDTLSARAMIYAVAFQESGFQKQRQVVKFKDVGKIVYGQARSFWQFETSGVRGVLEHHSSSYHARLVLSLLYINKDNAFEAIAYSDALASAFARLLLWQYPDPLPDENNPDEGWKQYNSLWKPGKPRPEAWPDNFKRGWELAIIENGG